MDMSFLDVEIAKYDEFDVYIHDNAIRPRHKVLQLLST
jgi:hypothetical protein